MVEELPNGLMDYGTWVFPKPTDLPPVPEGCRRLWSHLFPTRAKLAEFVGVNKGNSKHFDDPWEPGAYTDDYDDMWCAKKPVIAEIFGIGTVTQFQHEGRHIFIGPDDEVGLAPHEHHRWSDLCVGVGHGIRLHDKHDGGFKRWMAANLLKSAQASMPDSFGVRHGYIDVPETLIAKRES